MKVFLDTNVLVSATATRGLCADVLREVLVSHRLVVISGPLLTELKNALRKKLGVPDDLTAELVEILQQDAHYSTPSALPDVDIRDRDDIAILSSALNGGADIFITGDKDICTAVQCR